MRPIVKISRHKTGWQAYIDNDILPITNTRKEALFNTLAYLRRNGMKEVAKKTRPPLYKIEALVNILEKHGHSDLAKLVKKPKTQVLALLPTKANSPAMVNFDKKKFLALKKAYNKAKKDNKKVFEFEGNQLLVDYAKYLIEYLEPKF